MLKKPFAAVSAMSAILALSACSPKHEKPATQTASTSTSTTSPSTTTTLTPTIKASAVTITTPTPTVASATTTTVASTTTTTITTPATAEKLANTTASVPTTTAATPNAALKADLTQLFRTLNELDRNTQAKQAEMAQKMQNAKTPADQKAFFKEVVTQLDLQKATLTKLQFNDPRVAKTRDKMVESITSSRAGTAELIKKPNATPESNPEIAKYMENAQKSAQEARAMLIKLTDEAGIKANPTADAPTARKK